MTEVYEIGSDGNALDLDALAEFVPETVSLDQRDLLLSRFGPVVENLWKQKARIDQDVEGYRAARDKLLGDLKEAKESSRTRAGRKFEEICTVADFFSEISDHSLVVDLCGAPGAFSLVLQQNFPTLKILGFSLKSGISWFPEISRNFRSFYGVDGDGDLYSAANRKSLVEEISDHCCPLVLADGGFEEISDLQELVLSPLIFSEFITAISLLAEHGNFLCKIFDCFSELTRSIIFLLTRIFRRVLVVKPASSRVVNSERYLLCLRKIADLPQIADLPAGKGFLSLVPLEMMDKDLKFVDSMEVMTVDIAVRQTAALRRVLDHRDSRHKRVKRA